MSHIELTNLTYIKTALRKSYFILFSNYTPVFIVSPIIGADQHIYSCPVSRNIIEVL